MMNVLNEETLGKFKIIFSKNNRILLDLVFCSFIILMIGVIVTSFASSIFLFSFNMWNINIHLIGFAIPFSICLYSLYRVKLSLSSLLFGIVSVTIMSFFVTIPVVEKGIVSPFPFSLFPALLGALISLFMFRHAHLLHRFVFSYSICIFGVFLGADLFHLPSLLLFQPDVPMEAVIGGAGVFDLISISGLISCLFLVSHFLVYSFFMTLSRPREISVKN